jgi:hypothetical protein
MAGFNQALLEATLATIPDNNPKPAEPEPTRLV